MSGERDRTALVASMGMVLREKTSHQSLLDDFNRRKHRAINDRPQRLKFRKAGRFERFLNHFKRTKILLFKLILTHSVVENQSLQAKDYFENREREQFCFGGSKTLKHWK